MSRIRTFFLVFLLWTLVGMISKGAFLLIYHSLFANATFSELCQVFWYGLRLDIAVAGYMTGIPGLAVEWLFLPDCPAGVAGLRRQPRPI